MDSIEQFNSIFSNLNEESWKTILTKENFVLGEVPY